MSGGCGQLFLFIFWMISGMFGLVILLSQVMGMPLWVSIIVVVLLVIISWLATGET